MKKTKRPDAADRIASDFTGYSIEEMRLCKTNGAWSAADHAKTIRAAIKRAVKAEAVRVATVAIKQLGIVSAGLWRVDDPTRLHLQRAIDGAVDAVDGTITIHTKGASDGK